MLILGRFSIGTLLLVESLILDQFSTRKLLISAHAPGLPRAPFESPLICAPAPTPTLCSVLSQDMMPLFP